MRRFIWWCRYVRQDLELFPVPKRVVRARLKEALRVYTYPPGGGCTI